MFGSYVDGVRLGAGVLAISLLFGCPTVRAQDERAPLIESSALQAVLLDGATGTVLFQKNPDTRFPPASLAKMMTMEIIFDALRKGAITLDTTYPISEHAWRTGGAPSRTSTMFAKVRSQVPVAALIRGTIVQSANDAAIALAEGMDGSEAAFAERMNRRAAELGLMNSHFVNPTGLPADGQYVTARDLTVLARHIREAYPELYKIYAEPSFEWNNIFQRNRNPLLSMDIGADGMETGYTEASGYGLVGVTERSGRETFLTLGGLATAKDRAEEARKLLNFANEKFRSAPLFSAGEVIGSASVFGGEAGNVTVAPDTNVVALVPTDAPELVTAAIRYEGPLTAPVAKGEKVAVLDILVEGKPVLSHDLFATRAVEAGSFSDRAASAAKELAFGWMRAF